MLVLRAGDVVKAVRESGRRAAAGVDMAMRGVIWKMLAQCG